MVRLGQCLGGQRSSAPEHADWTAGTDVLRTAYVPGVLMVHAACQTRLHAPNPHQPPHSQRELHAGTPAKPAISQAAGSDALTATISIAKVFTATKYTVVLVDVANPANNKTEVLTPVDSETGPWTPTITAPRKGTYRVEVRSAFTASLASWAAWRPAQCIVSPLTPLRRPASPLHTAAGQHSAPHSACLQVTAANEFDATSDKAVSEAVVVGLPDAPTLPADAVAAGVGKITLKWSAPEVNAFIGTQ